MQEELPAYEMAVALNIKLWLSFMNIFFRADLTVDDIDRINESLNADHIKM